VNDRDFLNPDETFDFDSGSTGEVENLVLNLDDVSDELPKFEPIPPGVYDAIVENVEFGNSQNSGSPMLTFQFRITDPDYENRMLFYHTVLNKESGLSRLKRLLVRVAPDVPLNGFNPAKFADEGVILGYPCRLKVNIRSYKGEKRNNVVDVLAPEDSPTGFLDE